jgi:hypothetical protein
MLILVSTEKSIKVTVELAKLVSNGFKSIANLSAISESYLYLSIFRYLDAKNNARKIMIAPTTIAKIQLNDIWALILLPYLH